MTWDRHPKGVVRLQIAAHGCYKMPVKNFDRALEKYLPATFEELHKLVAVRATESGWPIDYSDLKTVTECLFILSEYDGNNW